MSKKNKAKKNKKKNAKKDVKVTCECMHDQEGEHVCVEDTLDAQKKSKKDKKDKKSDKQSKKSKKSKKCKCSKKKSKKHSGDKKCRCKDKSESAETTTVTTIPDGETITITANEPAPTDGFIATPLWMMGDEAVESVTEYETAEEEVIYEVVQEDPAQAEETEEQVEPEISDEEAARQKMMDETFAQLQKMFSQAVERCAAAETGCAVMEALDEEIAKNNEEPEEQ